MKTIFTLFLLSIISVFSLRGQETLIENFGNVSSETSISTHESANGFSIKGLTYSGTGDVRTTLTSTTPRSGNAILFMGSNERELIIDGFDINAACSVSLTFYVRKTTIASDGSNLVVEYSTVGSSGPWTSAGTASLPTGSGTTTAYNGTTLSLPNNFKSIRFHKLAASTTTQFRLEDLTFVGSNTDCVFPVTLTSFKASTLGQEVILDWETTDESNFSHFSVERSLDPRNGFEAIGRVDAKAKLTTDGTAYQFVDQTPNFGLNYYRLKKVDIDGTSDYSRIITANMTETSPIIIYPNPAADFIRIKNGEKEAIKSYEIYNISGRLIRQNESPATEIKILDLPSGVYFLQLKNERNVLINRRFIKI